MKVELGNDHAIEQYRDPASDQPNLVRKRPYPGEHVTTLIIPDEQPLTEAFQSVVGIMVKHHLEEGASPAWVESDNEELETLLASHWKINKSRPKGWGNS